MSGLSIQTEAIDHTHVQFIISKHMIHLTEKV